MAEPARTPKYLPLFMPQNDGVVGNPMQDQEGMALTQGMQPPSPNYFNPSPMGAPFPPPLEGSQFMPPMMGMPQMPQMPQPPMPPSMDGQFGMPQAPMQQANPLFATGQQPPPISNAPYSGGPLRRFVSQFQQQYPDDPGRFASILAHFMGGAVNPQASMAGYDQLQQRDLDREEIRARREYRRQSQEQTDIYRQEMARRRATEKLGAAGAYDDFMRDNPNVDIGTPAGSRIAEEYAAQKMSEFRDEQARWKALKDVATGKVPDLTGTRWANDRPMVKAAEDARQRASDIDKRRKEAHDSLMKSREMLAKLNEERLRRLKSTPLPGSTADKLALAEYNNRIRLGMNELRDIERQLASKERLLEKITVTGFDISGSADDVEFEIMDLEDRASDLVREIRMMIESVGGEFVGPGTEGKVITPYGGGGAGSQGGGGGERAMTPEEIKALVESISVD